EANVEDHVVPTSRNDRGQLGRRAPAAKGLEVADRHVVAAAAEALRDDGAAFELGLLPLREDEPRVDDREVGRDSEREPDPGVGAEERGLARVALRALVRLAGVAELRDVALAQRDARTAPPVARVLLRQDDRTGHVTTAALVAGAPEGRERRPFETISQR